ncbi:hypothetical protein PVAP13_8KG290700 [Panicum virgatum]|uniref:NB-ARC domain-containing protein n=2 Tax=Panicum virgatum TaxID=38727 RepID=A0A8T0PUZ3_PANVG|nr:hypothetical protein PVAP13_8KG290700 [Panicum virgatum]
MTSHNKTEQMRKEKHQHFNLMTNCNELESVDVHEKPSDETEELIVGRTDEKNEIVAALRNSMNHKFTILPIYGIGGIGKTTFAKLICNDTNFTSYHRVWVHVSQRFDLNKICDSIISQLPDMENQTNNGQCLVKLFSGKKTLIVLNDLWEDNAFQLEGLKDKLGSGDRINTIVLVTTRSEYVARKTCANFEPYKIKCLTNDMCWEIIKRKSGFEARDDKEHLIVTGREIALKCGGVALAAQSLGFMLKSMTVDQWKEVKDSDI